MNQLQNTTDLTATQEAWRSERSLSRAVSTAQKDAGIRAVVTRSRRERREVERVDRKHAERLAREAGGAQPSSLDTKSDCLHAPVLTAEESYAVELGYDQDRRSFVALADEKAARPRVARMLGRDRNPEIVKVEERRQRAWCVAKALEIGASNDMEPDRLMSWSGRMSNCGDKLLFAECEDGHHRRLRSGYFCQVRACPICAWRRALRDKAAYTGLIQAARKEGYQVLHLVLTLANSVCPDGQLNRLWKAFHALRRRAIWGPVKGAIAKVEVTWHEDTGYHFHLHVLVAVPPLSAADRKAGKVTIRHEDLKQAWHQVTGDSFIVWISKVKAQARHYRKAADLGLGRDGALVAALDELVKYPAKDDDFFTVGKGKSKRVILPHDLETGEVSEEFQKRSLAYCELLLELHGKNLKSLTGFFRGRKEAEILDEEAQVFISEEDKPGETACPCCGKPLVGVVYRHRRGMHYEVAVVGPWLEIAPEHLAQARHDKELLPV